MIAAGIAQLKITLDEVEPAVMRRVEVPRRIRLDRLHLVFQAAIGWTNSHLYEIRARDVGWGIPDPDYGDGPLDARKARLADVLEDIGTKSLKYLYDFGDGWEHSVRVERITDAVPGIAYPRLIAATGRCPPEDVGGPWVYHDFLEAIADPRPRTARRERGVARRELRSNRGRCRAARRQPRRPRQALVAHTHTATQAIYLTRGPRRMLTFRREVIASHQACIWLLSRRLWVCGHCPTTSATTRPPRPYRPSSISILTLSPTSSRHGLWGVTNA